MFVERLVSEAYACGDDDWSTAAVAARAEARVRDIVTKQRHNDSQLRQVRGYVLGFIEADDGQWSRVWLQMVSDVVSTQLGQSLRAIHDMVDAAAASQQQRTTRAHMFALLSY